MEVFTSANCPLCPDAEIVAQRITSRYPEVIWINHHLQDSLTIPQSQQLWFINGNFALPKVMVNRSTYNGQRVLEMQSVEDAVRDQLSQPPEVEINIVSQAFSNISLYLLVQCTFLQDVQDNSSQYTPVLFFVEDSVIGVGMGYDQLNIYNSVPGHPYWGRGDTIRNYPHRYVIRNLVVANPITSNPTAGTVSRVPVSIQLPKTLNPMKCSVIVAISRTDRNGSVIIAAKKIPLPTIPTYILPYSLTLRRLSPALVPESTVSDIRLQTVNTYSSPIYIYIQHDSLYSRLPTEWRFSVPLNPYTVKARLDTIACRIETNNKGGFATISLLVDSWYNDSIRQYFPIIQLISFLSAATHYVAYTDLEIKNGKTYQPYTTHHTRLKSFYQSVFDNIPPARDHSDCLFSDDEAAGVLFPSGEPAYPRCIVAHFNARWIGPFGYHISLLPQLLFSKRLLIHGLEGTTGFVFVRDPLSTDTNKPFTRFFTKQFGIKNADEGIIPDTSGFIVEVDTNSPLSSILPRTFHCNGSSCIQKSWLLDNITELDTNAPSVPFLRLQSTNRAIGFLHQTDTTRAILLSFRLESITDSLQRIQITSALIDWLMKYYHPSPSIKVLWTTRSDTVVFDTTTIGNSTQRTIGIYNSGDTTLTINAIETEPPNIFKVVGDFQLPLQLNPAQTLPLRVEFHPSDSSTYYGECSIYANIPQGPKLITLIGNSTLVANAEDTPIATNSSSINIYPIPASSTAYISYPDHTNADLLLYNSQGIVVYSIPLQPNSGYHRLDIPTLPSGVYRLVVRSGRHTLTTPIMIIN